MKNKAFFGVVLTAWIFGIFLIANFPPISDGKVTDNLAYLSQDAFPEIYLRNSITTKSFSSELDYRPGGLGVVIEFSPLANLLDVEHSKLIFDSTVSLFDTKILFQPFFETW
jgi:hypothetical protein